MKILIFGATGNTGAYLVDYFKKQQEKNLFEIIAVGSKNTSYFSKHGIEYCQIDISKASDFSKLPTSDVHAVVHTAAKLPTHASINQPRDFINVNIVGTLNILEYCKKVSVDRIIFTQTMSNIANIFGKVSIIKPDIPRDFPLEGDHAMYVISKNTAEDLVRFYHNEYKIKMFVFKIPTIYQYRENRYWYVDGKKRLRTFQYFIDKAVNGERIEMWGDPNSYKDLVYVKDYCQMIYKAAFIKGLNEGIYNVGTGIPVSLETMLKEIVNVFSNENNRSQIIHKPDKPNTNSYIIDVSNAKSDLGYEPQYDLTSMLQDIKDEMEKNRFISLRTNNQ